MDFGSIGCTFERMTIQVQAFMTPSPHTIGRDQPLDRAARMFRDFHVRHLPVLAGGNLVGMLSERDVALVETLGVDSSKEIVESAMSQDCYAVAPTDELGKVAAHMAQHKYGSAVVTDDDKKVVGVLTTVDICRALAELAR